RHVQKHLCSAFMALAVPKEIKTDNGPGYTSKATAKIFQQWGIQHVTGIPSSPTGLAIVEGMHQT
ncbi:POK19 protein, partial [Centropus unirufus]|nr:POK19 protein [Centropus unirufus]